MKRSVFTQSSPLFPKRSERHHEVEESVPNPLRLSIVTQFFPPDYAPTGQLLDELTHHLRQQNIQVQIFTGQPGYAFQQETAPNLERSQNLIIRRTRTARLWSNRIRGKAINGLMFWVRAGLHLLKPENWGDVLLLPTAPPFLPILGYLLHWVCQRPYICLLYDIYPDVAIALKVVPAKHWVARLWHLINRQVWRNAAHIIVLSSTMEECITQHCPEVAQKISIIHNWADPNRIVPIPKQHNWFALKHQLTDVFTVLYSGNMGRCHDMDTLLEAAIHLKDEPVQFVLIGDGAQRKICIEFVKQQGLKNVLFLPYQDKQDLPYSLTACDLALVSVSSNMEGLVAPSKFYSALASGRPVAVVCSPHSYLRQILVDANCGQTFRSGDSAELTEFIRTLMICPELAEHMGQAGRQYLQKHFTPEVISQQYASIFWKIGSKNLTDCELTHYGTDTSTNQISDSQPSSRRSRIDRSTIPF